MEREKTALAIDYGASGGRVIKGTLHKGHIELEELHRFTNDPVSVGGTLYWDVLRLFYEMKQGMIAAKNKGGFCSVGVATWGVDFGLLDEEGRLLENPIHYRDTRTYGMLEKAFLKVSEEELYQVTGNQFMEINTAFQLLSLAENRPEFLERAHTMLLMPDLFNYFLTGVKVSENSIASTTQLFNAEKKDWAWDIIQKLQIPSKIFRDSVKSGTEIGFISEELCSELGVDKVPVIAVAGHDTQSALLSIPAEQKDFLFISCGTWSLFGTELDSPLLNETARLCEMTNEIGYAGKISFLKNIIGLWLIQESRRQWIREGKTYSFSELEQEARKATKLRCFIDPAAKEFVAPGNMPERIKDYCKQIGGEIPTTVGEIVRCINESLALTYRMTKEQIESCTGKTYDTIHMAGGGIQSELLCQFTASACGCKVVAGPVEATVLGNLALQFMTQGEISGLEEARRVIANSVEIKTYFPEDKEAWEEAYVKFKKEKSEKH